MNGFIQIIKQVPEYVWIFDFQNKGYQRLKKERSVIPKLNEILSREPRGSPYDMANIKPRLSQSSRKEIKRRMKNATSQKDRNK